MSVELSQLAREYALHDLTIIHPIHICIKMKISIDIHIPKCKVFITNFCDFFLLEVYINLCNNKKYICTAFIDFELTDDKCSNGL